MQAPFPSSAELTAIVASNAAKHEKAFACQQLAIVGGADAVPALAGLLGDEQLSTYARSALETIAAPVAGGALMKSMPVLSARLLAGVIDSLGVRRELPAVPELRKLATGPAGEVADEALAALGKIATGDALVSLRAALKSPVAGHRTAAAHASLVAAGILLKDGKRQDAADLLDAVIAADLPGRLRDAASALRSHSVRRRIFDGTTFDGWEGDTAWFRIVGGAIVAGSLSQPIPRNEFLCTKREFANFELRLKFKLAGGQTNAGVQIRSRRVPGSHEVSGYQADLGEPGVWGNLYDEARRNKTLVKADQDALKRVLKLDDWNEYRIRCEGRRIQLRINGHQTADYMEPDEKLEQTGIIGLQIHSGKPGEAWYKDLEIEELSP